ncbi:RAD50-interacting protein 1 [Lachnellula arida]|uniref:RAD50-interacting protein 1 n=1 Tax=Lachnellula arida TaxID=1316785 RepID=A0A8T9BCX5_9HELO|nr:RAD50-interacting protein 1 [Lachnellula arida]
MPSSSVTRDISPLAVLLDPQRNNPMLEKDVRLEDYLNDKIQTSTDFGNLKSLIANIDLQKKQLEKQLQDAKSKLQEAKQSSANHSSSMLEQTQEFERQQASVQKRLMIVTNAHTPEEATKRLRGPMEKLRKVELANSYVEMLQEVDDLTKDARSHLPAHPKAALRPYIQLKELSLSLVDLQGPADEAAPHLVRHVQNTTKRLWVDMKRIMTDEFEAILRKSNWPENAPELTREWSDCFERLLDLQSPEILAAREPIVLLPMEVLCRNFVLQFRYHFFGDRDTAQTKHLGSYFFEWFIGTVVTWERFLNENVTPVLAAHFRGSQLAGNSLHVNSIAAFITAMLPVVKEKVNSLLLEISNEPRHLSKFIHQLMLFDDSVRSTFSYDGGNLECGWKGLLWDVLDTWFDRWSQIEKEFALERYREIIQSEDSGQIDYDSATSGKTKTTHGATKVADLIQSVTEQYNKLRRFSHKVRFLISIQAEILDQYLGRLADSLERYMSVTTTVGRTLHGVTKEERARLEGTGGLESLCRVYGSADHIISKLKESINDEFFVDLWEVLQERAKVTSTTDRLVGSMSYNEVRDCTSDAVGSTEEGSVFDVTIAAYQRLANRTESLITQAIKYALPNSFKAYLTKPEWTTVGEVPTSLSIAITAELDQPLQTLKENSIFLRDTISYAAYRRIWRECFDTLQDLLFQEVLLKQTFTTLGAARLMGDIDAIQSVVDSTSRGAGSALSMPKLKDGVTLLNVPLEAAEGGMSLKEVYEKICSVTQSDEVFEQLGLTRLTSLEARKIMQNRIEAVASWTEPGEPRF